MLIPGLWPKWCARCELRVRDCRNEDSGSRRLAHAAGRGAEVRIIVGAAGCVYNRGGEQSGAAGFDQADRDGGVVWFDKTKFRPNSTSTADRSVGRTHIETDQRMATV